MNLLYFFSKCSRISNLTSSLKYFQSTNDTIKFDKLSSYFCNLSNRKILQVTGQDALSVLQGLSSNNIKIFSQKFNKLGLYSCFLNSQGRVLFDAFIIRPYVQRSEEIKELACLKNEYWLDIHQNQFNQAITHLKQYSFRRRIRFEDITDNLKIYQLIVPALQCDEKAEGDYWKEQYPNPPKEEKMSLGNNIYQNISFYDPRSSRMGVRIICSVNEQFQFLQEDIQQKGVDTYNNHRFIQGICEGEEISQKLPFQYNLDLMNAISLNKGCYLGQEVMNRTYTQGIIRKRLYPFMLLTRELEQKIDLFSGLDFQKFFEEKFPLNFMNQKLISYKNEQIGKIIAQKYNYGQIIMDPEYLRANGPQVQLGKYKGTIIQNDWFYLNLMQYEKMKGKITEENKNL